MKRKGFRFSVRGAVAGAIVVLGAVIAAWWMWPEGDCAGETPAPQAKQRIREVAPAERGGTLHPQGTAQAKAAAEAFAEPMTNEVAAEAKKPGVFAPGMIRLPNGFELRFKLPKEGETRQLLAGGEFWEIDSKGNIENITPLPIFENPFEGLLSALYERDGEVIPFQLNRYSEEEVRKMCKEPTYSYEDDTPEITRRRENMVMLKKAVLEFLDAGGKFAEFVEDMSKHSQNAQLAHNTGFLDIHDLLSEGKTHEALEYYRAMSAEMEEKGYGELNLPPDYKAALEEQMKLEEQKK